ncbi:hypothetical protein BS47DRAFT_1417218 [Hydnum rufescens UP504]|uniref:Cytidyltransferase-like domain-containing protein n=1 Tax=Hydnum rufescens UP504 TaxID=1448309 RepID=A0A9P6DS55_9AGAM|nr:hypothetical protein BS47DRAFT_1417218 [Hydnum rufescens UP504]
MASSSSTPETGYSFPIHRLSHLNDPEKIPIVLVACGSFSPITYAHLRMFEMAQDFCRQNTDFEVVAGYLSPVGDEYKKAGLLSASRRVEMCRLACDQASSWLMVDDWEASTPEYQRTAIVLDHFDHAINTVRGGVSDEDGTMHPVRVMLLAGSDLIHTMSEPGVWSAPDLEHILGGYGTQLIHNDVSSTKIRLFLRRGMSVHYLLPDSVIRYIKDNRLYVDDSNTGGAGSEKLDSKGDTRPTAPWAPAT